MKKYNLVYKTTCLITDKYYIGVHITDKLYDGYLGSGLKLKLSVSKHGKDNHSREILEHLNTREEAYELEAKIVNLDLLKDKLCMNLNIGGYGGSYYVREETKAKISKSLKGKMIGDKNGMFGKTHSIESRKKISEANLGLKHSENRKSNMKGRSPWNKGVKTNKISSNSTRSILGEDKWIELINELKSISKIVRDVTYKELSLKWDMEYRMVQKLYLKHVKNNKAI